MSAALPRRIVSVLAIAALLVSVLASLPAEAAGRTYFLAPDGNDGGRGDQASPWQTFKFAMEQLRAGDTLYVRGGVYEERVFNMRPLAEGTPDARITVSNYPGERPILRGTIDIKRGGAHYWTFNGFEITWNPELNSAFEPLVRMIDGVGWELTNLTIYGNRSYAGLRIAAETAGLARDWAVRDSCIHTSIPTNGVNMDHNVYVGGISEFAPSNGVIERNVIFGAPNGANIKLGPGEPGFPGTSSVVVQDNILGGAPQNVIVAWQSHHNTIRNNLLIQQHNGTWSQPWYPNIRGLDLTGGGNVAGGNGGETGANVVDSWKSPARIADDGNAAISVNLGNVTDPCTELRNLGGAARVFGPDSIVERIAGTSRVATAAALSKTAYRSATAVILARADNYADALAGAPLAGHLGAPLLLTDSKQLSDEARARIQELKPQTAYLMGGVGAISSDVERTLVRDFGLTVKRLAGKDRFATAAAVAQLLPASDEVFLVEGANPDPARGWPDAVALSPLAARTANPVLLTLKGEVPAATKAALKDLAPTKVTIVGGPAAVSDTVAKWVADSNGDGKPDRKVSRLAGSDRFETSAAVALAATSAGADPSNVWLVTGLNWPDALAAGPAAAAAGASLLFVHRDDARFSPSTLNWLDGRTDPQKVAIQIVGGPGAVSLNAEATLAYGLD